MKPLNFKYQYFTLVFIFLFVLIGSVDATDNSPYNDKNGDSSSVIISSDFNQTKIKNYMGDDKNINSLSSSKTTKTIISSKGLTLDYGNEGYVVGYLKTSSGKPIPSKVVKITINSQTWCKTTDSKGKVSLKIMNFTPNIYPTKFSFAGESGYSASSSLVNVTVNKINTKIIADDLYLYDDGILVAYLKDSKNNSLKNKLVKFTINNYSFNTFSDCDGKITFNVPSLLEAKNYSSIIKFVGDKLYSSSSRSVKIYKFDNNTIESFITALINSTEFSKLLNNSFNSDLGNFSNKSYNNQDDVEFTYWFMNRTNDEINSISQFLNLISYNPSNKLDFKTITPPADSKEEIDNNIIEDLWKWLNTPILEIPGYGDLDKKYGVLGQSLKLAGWFLLGIDDNGGLTPLDIGLDALSICSGTGLAERIGFSSSSLILKLADKFPRFNSLLKNSIKIQGLDYSITIKSLFNAYKSTLSLANNPIKFVSNKIITNLLDKSDNKIASFAIGYFSNSFITISNVLGISEVYVNAKNNTLFTSNLISNLSNINSIKTVIDSSQSSVASTIKNVKTTADSLSKTIKTTTNTITKTLNSFKKEISSIYNSLSKKLKSYNLYKKVKKAVSSVKKVVNKAVSSVKTSSDENAKKAVNSVKKAVKKITGTVKKAVNSAKKNVKKVSKSVNSKVTGTVSSVKKAVNKAVSSVKTSSVKTVNKVVSSIKKVTGTVKKAVNNAKKTVSSLISKLF